MAWSISTFGTVASVFLPLNAVLFRILLHEYFKKNNPFWKKCPFHGKKDTHHASKCTYGMVMNQTSFEDL